MAGILNVVWLSHNLPFEYQTQRSGVWLIYAFLVWISSNGSKTRPLWVQISDVISRPDWNMDGPLKSHNVMWQGHSKSGPQIV